MTGDIEKINANRLLIPAYFVITSEKITIESENKKTINFCLINPGWSFDFSNSKHEINARIGI